MQKSLIVLFLALLFVSLNVQAAILSGTVYEWFSFEPLDNAIIVVDSIPRQTIVSTNGAYSFELSPGNYVLRAEYFENGSLIYATDENVSIVLDGNFVLDLLMFPVTDFDDSEFPQNIDVISVQDLEPQNHFDFFPFFFVALIAIVLISLFVFFKSKKSLKPVSQSQKPLMAEIQSKTLPNNLDKHASFVLDVLKRYGGRMTQKELREKTDFGEAKLSLIVAELESMNLVKKIKKGRGNIIVLIH